MLDTLESEGDLDPQFQSKIEAEATELIRKYGGYIYLTCSALTGLRVKDVFENAVKATFERSTKAKKCDLM